MEALGVSTDPVPYIAASFGLGVVGILGFTAWTLWERQQLRRLLAAIKPKAQEQTSASRLG